MCLCEAAAYYRTLGKTLCDAMRDMYKKYGNFREGLASVTLRGADGAEKIRDMMSSLRRTPPASVGGMRVTAVRDYKAGTRTELATGRQTAVNLPQSNVLYFELEGDGWCCVRPSGTEPKIKFYCGVKAEPGARAEELLAAVMKDLRSQV